MQLFRVRESILCFLVLPQPEQESLPFEWKGRALCMRVAIDGRRLTHRLVSLDGEDVPDYNVELCSSKLGSELGPEPDASWLLPRCWRELRLFVNLPGAVPVYSPTFF